MALLQTVCQNPEEQPEEGRMDPSILIEGNPVLHKWLPMFSKSENIKVGVISSGVGVNRSIKDGMFEFCYLLEGKVELTEDGCEPVIYEAGDSFFMDNGYRGQWRTIEPYKKIYLCVYGQ